MLRRLVLAVLLMWLPLQGLAALTMPFCRHAPGTAAGDVVAQHGSAADHAGHAHHHDASGAAQEPVQPAMSLTCNDCGACHLACAAAMLPAPVMRAAAPASGGPDPAPAIAPLAHVPDQPNPPPLPRA